MFAYGEDGTRLRRVVSIRVFQPGDVAACLRAMQSNVPEFFAASEIADFEQELAALDGPYLVIEDDELGVAACGGYYVDAGSRSAWLVWGLVHRARHGWGLGTLLLRDRLRRIEAELGGGGAVLLDTSRRSHGFFERFGFELEKVTPDGYAPGLDRLDMRLTLPG